MLSAQAALAQVQINAEVNKTQATLDDQIVLSVTVTGPQASLPEPELPALANFSVYSSGRNQSISFINGRVSSSIVHTYVLVPRFVGKGVIAPISLNYQGTKAQTEPIEIQVQPPGGGSQNPAAPAPAPHRSGARMPPARAPAGSPDVFVSAELDKKKAFVNEQATLSVKFYTAINLLGNPQYNAPKISGFLAEDLPPERHGNVVIRGRTYYFSEIKTALFPAQAGRLSIGAASVRCQVQQDITVDPFAPDFFDKFFSQGLAAPRTRELSSEPLSLEALPLPEANKPKDFSGAVGKFSISAAVDRAKTKVGEAVNLTVTVEGTGNLKSIADPKMPEMQSFRVYDTVSSLNLDKNNDRVRGSKVFRTVLVPRVSGDIAIPPVAFTYFDPQERAYRSAGTLPMTLKAAPAEPGAAGAPGYAPPAAAPQGLTAISEDIRYLKTRTEKTGLAKGLERAAGAGPWHAVPFLLFAAFLGLTQYRRLRESDPRGLRLRNALRSASARIREARGLGPRDPHRAAALMSEALCRYLADKLDQPPAGLTLRGVQDLLRLEQPGLNARLLERIRALWEELDLRRFSPAGAKAAAPGTQDELALQLVELLKDLEKEMRK